MRKVLIDDRNLLKILNDKESLQKEINTNIDRFKNLTSKSDKLQSKIKELQEEFKIEYDKVKAEVEKIEEEMKPYLIKLERYKDKVNPIVESKGIELGEFEIITSVLLEKGKVMVEIEDLVEAYKENLRAKKGTTNDTGRNTKNSKGSSK